LSWTKDMAIRGQNISEFLSDPVSMMNNRGCWQDGQAAVSWLTGTHVGPSWVMKGKQAIKEKDQMEVLGLNLEKILDLAADKLDNIFWFGILEDTERSLELLQYQLQLPDKVSFSIFLGGQYLILQYEMNSKKIV
jgi:hypothetical protein